MFASDDLVYFSSALEIVHGQLSSSDYIGAIRFGVNFPIAGAMWLFGTSLWSAALVPLLCSLGELVVVATVVREAWGAKAALSAAIILGFIPLHIVHATSIHADPLLAFAITLTFALFWKGERTNCQSFYLAAGIAAGWALWIKEASVLFLFAFALYALVKWQWKWSWLYAACGALAMFLLNCVFMWAISGDFFHEIAVMRSLVGGAWVAIKVKDSPFYYLEFLFENVRHTWLAGYLATFGVATMFVRRRSFPPTSQRFAIFESIWLIGLLAAFSLTPVSFSPLRFVMKQSNYMTIFLAPLAIAGGYGVSSMGRGWRAGTLAVVVVGGVLLAALAQQDARAWVANGEAAEAFAMSHPEDKVYATNWAARISRFHALLRSPTGTPAVGDLHDLRPQPAAGPRVLVVFDRQTWGRSTMDVEMPGVPACWRRIGTLPPTGFGYGADVTRALVWAAWLLPSPLGPKLAGPFEALLHPKPAELYTVPPADPWCGAPVPSKRGWLDRSG